MTNVIKDAINIFVGLCNKRAVVAGWYNDPATGAPTKRKVGEQLALIHSEISEAL